jgi:hypothetical protein
MPLPPGTGHTVRRLAGQPQSIEGGPLTHLFALGVLAAPALLADCDIGRRLDFCLVSLRVVHGPPLPGLLWGETIRGILPRFASAPASAIYPVPALLVETGAARSA